jgi:hypothetical protein
VGKGSAPDPPDYAAAAKEQGVANVNSAIASNFLNQVSQVGPNGSLTYSYDPTKGYTLPDGTRIPGVTATTTLSPEQQKLYTQGNQIAQSMNDVALQGLDYVGTAIKPVDTSGLPQFAQGLARTNFNGQIAPTDQQIAGNYDFSNVSQMPKYEDFNATRDKVTDAYMQRLQPYLDKERNALEQRLASQGITPGSEARAWDQDTFNRGANDQRIAALLAGDKASQDLFNNAMSLRGQGVSEAIAQGSFGNAAQQQEFGQNVQQAQFGNQAAEANFAQGLASSQFQNQARAQALQEQDYLRNQPINIINALRTGNQVQMPTFGNVAGGAQIAAPPIYQAANDQYSAALQQYQAQQQNSPWGAIAGLGGAAITKWSDRRLKSDIKLLARRTDGLGIYDYEIFGHREIGVIADEVAELAPHALGPIINGFQTVKYGEL